MKIFSAKKLFTFLSVGLLFACYSPDQYEGNTISDNDSAQADFGTVYEVNGGKQICNPSISMDAKNYPGSMLWLNFSGTLNVKETKGFTTTKVGEHDRLTVSDTAGNVQWFVMMDSVGVECEFQDPEWSANSEYIVALAGSNAKGSRGCDEVEYKIVAIRLSDKAHFILSDSVVDESANPHLWVGEPSASKDSSDSFSKFFGTKNVKFVYKNPAGSLVYVDYAKSKKPKKLKAPAGANGSLLDSPMISPDGNFIVYDKLTSSYEWNSYIQELSTSSIPVEIQKSSEQFSNPVFPHWWKFGDKLFLVWAEFAAGNAYLNKSDLTDKSTWDASIGRTVMRELSIAAGAPSDVAIEWNGDVRQIAPIPLIGGRSPDGHFVATGTNNGYLLYIP